MMPDYLNDSGTLGRDVAGRLREVPDFPRPGILFRDITPLLADHALFKRCTRAMAELYVGDSITHVIAIESRGFLFGAPIAQLLDAALVPIRKPGKLPARSHRIDYALEYGSDALEVHADACDHRATALIVDDVLATGGTAAAAAALVRRLGADVAGFTFLLELSGLGGRATLTGSRVESVLAL